MSETAVATHEVYRFKVGAFDCTVILDETGTDAADRLLALVPEEERKRVLAEQGLASDQITMTYNPLLIEVDGWRILLDSGNGVETGGDGRLLPTLAELGIALDSITDVVLTHAHADHYAGMLTASGDKVFPKARYIMWADEWAYYASDERMEIERQRGEDRHAVKIVTPGSASGFCRCNRT
jgi:glyoxylase-like metal-dependent hydrolase (beta-lactamase superfamily II)